jgi:hypothetical protein
MDLTQTKLTKSEWDNIEIPVSPDEKTIATMICRSYSDLNHSYNPSSSLILHVKINPSKEVHQQLFITYFQDHIRKLIKKYDIDVTCPTVKGCKIKSADRIRIQHTEDSLMQQKENIFEFIVLEFITSMLRAYKKKNNEWVYFFYTCSRIVDYNITEKNPYVEQFTSDVIRKYSEHVNIYDILRDSKRLIEENKNLLKYADVSLYDHQKRLFAAAKSPDPKLVLYIAPTGTGKTLSPLGLSENNRIIFMCAARHVGLALAKNAISCNKKVAFAFGCNDASDIRLHYFAAKEYTRHKKSGAIHKVDNSVGDKVEIMICDIQSYTYAMNYMAAFNPVENIILYWDEPTITLDYSDHPLHAQISSNWKDNIIPNIVLSSATLPKEHEIMPTIDSFRSKFAGKVVSIISHDCKKTISILTKENSVALPHLRYENYSDIQKSVEYCKETKTLLRYFDLGEIIHFIDYVNTNTLYKGKRYHWATTFTSIKDVTMDNIKTYYLELLGNIKPDKWQQIFEHCTSKATPLYDSSIRITTHDAHTLTDGPTIFLTENVEKISRFYLKDSKIPMEVVRESHEAIKFNNVINQRVQKLEKDIEDALAKDAEKDKKQAEARIPVEVKEMMRQAEDMRKSVKPASLHDMFIPNKRAHIDKWAHNKTVNSAYTSDITESTVERIMLLHDVDDSLKILLLMGIGVLTHHKSISYMEVMKELVNQQKLYLIIASSDFIYGTNYQFCHGYVSQDLKDISQEKAIQALGRIGRKNIQQHYSIRLRSNDMLDTLFLPQSNKPEVTNMNRLFG